MLTGIDHVQIAIPEKRAKTKHGVFTSTYSVSLKCRSQRCRRHVAVAGSNAGR